MGERGDSAISTRPNILVVQSDDHGQWASQPYGNSELRTWSMCELARTGTRLDRAFTPSPVCSPARACLWTGKIPSAHGIHDYIAEQHEAAADHPGLKGQPTLAQQLQDAGYRTGFCGKWHCHHSDEHQPGFDFWYANCSRNTSTGPHFGELAFSENGTIVQHRGFQSPRITDAALRFLRQAHQDHQGGDEQPFFLYVGYTNTHSPFADQPERFVAPFRRASFRDIPDEQPDDVHGSGRVEMTRVPDDPTGRRERLAQYYAAVEAIDEQLGRLLDELDSLGARENTLIVYTSDHGHMNGHHGLYCKGNATIPQNFLDESILVPCLLSWPDGGIAQGAVRREPVDHCDLYRTFLDAAGASLPEDGAPRPGKSALPLLRSEGDKWRGWQICEYGNARMIRTEHHKLVRRYPGPHGQFPDELFDLEQDPRERENRIHDPAYVDVIDRLTRQLDGYFDQYTTHAHSGLRAGDLPWHNSDEPWRLVRSQGTDGAQDQSP